MEERDYKRDLAIDPDSLDVAWLNQPTLYLYYAEQAAKARDVRDKAKQRLDVTQASIGDDIRRNPSKYGLEKVTVDAVANAVIAQPDYTAANDDYLQAKLEADLLQTAVNAFEMRKSALENLVRLHASSYFAGPQEPRDLSAAQREYVAERHHAAAQSNTRERIRERLNTQQEEAPPVRRNRS